MNPWDSVFNTNTGVSNDGTYANSLTPQINAAYQGMNNDTNYANEQQQVGAQNVQKWKSQQSEIEGMDGYPAMDNSYGLGSQVALNNATQSSNVQNSGIADTSRGFNPWSLTGEAMAR